MRRAQTRPALRAPIPHPNPHTEVNAMKTIDPTYADWMVTITYRAMNARLQTPPAPHHTLRPETVDRTSSQDQ